MRNIYVLIDPKTKHPRYVGATKHPIELRLSQHMGLRCKNGLLLLWLRGLKKLNKIPIIELIEVCEDKESGKKEFYWIKKYEESGFYMLNNHGAS